MSIVNSGLSGLVYFGYKKIFVFGCAIHRICTGSPEIAFFSIFYPDLLVGTKDNHARMGDISQVQVQLHNAAENA